MRLILDCILIFLPFDRLTLHYQIARILRQKIPEKFSSKLEFLLMGHSQKEVLEKTFWNSLMKNFSEMLLNVILIEGN